ncbi:ABC transporter substrate-binding protein [Pantanalinema rosaneae CENA516]|uniref:ABC transporter substrate-binding protein n=1 Tax=Pantanalinema rosaneae TaxID=1620701 RepID=UPI003D6E9C64
MLTLMTIVACQAIQLPTALKIGTLLPLTGDLAQYGASMQNSARLLVDTVNGCGGVLGQPVTLFAADDQTEPSMGVTAMTKLTEVDRVAGVVGAASSAVSSAAVNIAVRNQTILISPASTSPVFSDRARNGEFQGFWFRTAPPDTFQGQALAKLAISQGFKTIAILAINNDYGNGLINAFIPAFTEMGGQVVNQANPIRYPADAASFDSEVKAAFSQSPDAVLLIAYPETGSLILKTAYEQGLLTSTTKIMATDGMKETNIATTIGKNATGVYIATGMIGTAASAGGQGLADFQQRFITQYRQPPKIYDANTWDAAALLVLAAEAAKTLTGEQMKPWMREVANPPGTEVTDVCQALSLIRAGQPINYQGASGSVDLNDLGDVTGSYDIWTIAPDGKLQVIGTIAVS